MIDSISHISNKEEKHKCTLHLARHCGLPLATYCKVLTVRHTRSDLRCTNVSKENDYRNLMFLQYLNRFPALNSFFPLS